MEQKLLELRGTTREEQLYSTSATPLAVRSSTSTVPVRGSGFPNPARGPQDHMHYTSDYPTPSKLTSLVVGWFSSLTAVTCTAPGAEVG